MEHQYRCIILLSLYLPLITISTAGKQLRPSNHGLTNDANSPETAEAASPEMSSFFGAGGDSSKPLPEARNFTDPSYNSSGDGGSDDTRKILMVSSLVCGSAGVVLLGVVGFLFVRRYRNKLVN
ncbi:hypothetical protein QVD17_06789 [Tagetes erecta]|uniref:Transmembrane protein n=1 Tax=Tagetes erecta TaxID=13708 RepID=A0AAD8LEV7_TARER|nr:hypothetical protein QVD17_06789 [Tagetes erecta]